MIFIFLLLGLIRLILTQNPDNNVSNSDQPKFEDKCFNDIELFCPEEKHTWAILCLETYRDMLSKECSEYLGNTVIGGCNNEAVTLCQDQTDITDIFNCLRENEEKLSEVCLANLNNQFTQNNRWENSEIQYKHMTFVVSIISLIYLSVPLLFIIWSTFMMIRLYQIQKKVLQVSYTNKHISDLDEEEQNLKSHLQLEIGFTNLSYWVNDKPLISLYSKNNNFYKKQILRNVSGQFPTKSLTAIMGPSGSGKTTLLKLLAGQITNGEVKGNRLLNGQVVNHKDYLHIMNTQGYVAQQDYFLESLTVWETLYYAALLRIRENISVEEKLNRAALVMHEMGLESAANTILSNDSHNSENFKGISGGQRRRLSIAQALLGNPRAILLDEPTSGLDASTSMQLVKCLSKMTRDLHTTVALTIHQPRSEVFALFDNLILLGSGGYLVYSGLNSEAAKYLDSLPIVNLSLSHYDNPGDFIMDILGKSSKPNKKQEKKSKTITINQTNTISSNIYNFIYNLTNLSNNNKKISTDNTKSYELVSINDNEMISGDDSLISSSSDDNLLNTYDNIQNEINALNYLSDNTNNNTNISSDHLYVEPDDIDQSNKYIEFTKQLSKIFMKSDYYNILIDKYKIINPILNDNNNNIKTMPSVLGLSDMNTYKIIDISLQNILAITMKSPITLFDQIWILYSRRVQALLPTTKQFIMFISQLLLVGVIVTFTFSYSVTTSLELPYQVLMILVVISTYIMIVQHIGLVHDYMMERKVILSENTSGYINFWTYSFSAVLTEIPRAISQCFLFYTLIYSIRPVNPDPVFKLFFLVCLTIGTIAWHSQIAVTAALTDQISISYTLTFLVLGSGTLFGGLALRFSKIPKMFKIFYYFSVAAVTQRAIVANDMQCCYLTATCNSISQDIKRSNEAITTSNLRSTLSNQLYSKTLNNFINFDEMKELFHEDFINYDINRILNSNNTTLDTSSTSTTAISYLQNNNYCPPGLQFTGDGSDIGNLGRMYLKFMGLEHDMPSFSLIYLLLANILFRIISILILYIRKFMKYNLVYIPESN